MTSTRCAAALAAAALLVLAGCVTTKESWERSERIDQVHENAPRKFVGAWQRYLTQAQGRYGILALDRNFNGMGWLYCVQSCDALFGEQNKALKSAWAWKAINQCETAARQHAPATKPDCEIYALRDEIVWQPPFPWRVE